MPKMTLIEQAIENDKTDEEAVEMIRGAAKLFGRAVALSCMAAVASPRTTDIALEAADKQWQELADHLIVFALEND